MQPVTSPQMESHTGGLIMVGLVFLIIGIVYIIPTLVAFRRNHPNRWPILLVNVVFGGTVLGWGVALAWALRVIHRPGSTNSGGESGLNIFVNDIRRVRHVEPPPFSRPSMTQELERLHDLLVRGALSQEEFEVLKTKLMDDTPPH
jgi:Superinfection immunity protein/Short C-terminal domain